jgi:hypothetical protein
MPDHPRGYTRRGKGYQAPDEEVAEQYRENAGSDGILFDEPLQRALLEEGITACRYQGLRLHGGATEPSHAHYLVSWKSPKSWRQVRASLKSSLSRRLALEGQKTEDSRDATRRRNPRESDKGRWVLKLSRGTSRKHVANRGHFDCLMKKYLPGHSGVRWFEDERGWVAARKKR